jgi:pyridinium-3,5-bisthiocarboxylic acid mononucleotide nickel chelatase
LARIIVTVATPVGDVRFKIARQGDRIVNAQPEFDDLARIASDRGLPIKEVQAIAHKAWLDRPSDVGPGL